MVKDDQNVTLSIPRPQGKSPKALFEVSFGPPGSRLMSSWAAYDPSDEEDGTRLPRGLDRNAAVHVEQVQELENARD